MMIFLGILVIGFIYEWKKGALEGEERSAVNVAQGGREGALGCRG